MEELEDEESKTLEELEEEEMIRNGEFLEIGETPTLCLDCMVTPCVCIMTYLELKLRSLKGEKGEEQLRSIESRRKRLRNSEAGEQEHDLYTEGDKVLHHHHGTGDEPTTITPAKRRKLYWTNTTINKNNIHSPEEEQFHRDHQGEGGRSPHPPPPHTHCELLHHELQQPRQSSDQPAKSPSLAEALITCSTTQNCQNTLVS